MTDLLLVPLVIVHVGIVMVLLIFGLGRPLDNTAKITAHCVAPDFLERKIPVLHGDDSLAPVQGRSGPKDLDLSYRAGPAWQRLGYQGPLDPIVFETSSDGDVTPAEMAGATGTLPP